MNPEEPVSSQSPTNPEHGSTEPAANSAGGATAEPAFETLDFSSATLKLEADLKEANERCLRVQAELENYRKRSRRELEDERKYAALPLMRDMLSVLDNLQRAIEAAEKTQTSAALLDGVKMVAQQMLTFLDQHACQPIPAAGALFDPHLHEAIGQMPSAEVAAGYVAFVARIGYRLHDRVVRPAQVMVSTGAPS